MVKTVFFDLGNTIVDYHKGLLSDEEKDILGIWKMIKFLNRNNTCISFEKLKTEFYMPWIQRFPERKFLKKEIDVINILSRCIPSYKGNITELLLIFHEPTARFAIEIDRIRNCLKELRKRNILLGIISNSPIPGACHDLTLEKLKLVEYFKYRFYSYDVGCRKPNAEIFEYALNRSNSKPSECLMVGDNFDLDIAPALKQGIKSLWFNKKKVKPDKNRLKYMITSFDEIISKIGF